MEKERELQKGTYFCFIDDTAAFDCVGRRELRAMLKDMGATDRLTRLLQNLYAGQGATVKTTWNNRLVLYWERSTRL